MDREKPKLQGLPIERIEELLAGGRPASPHEQKWKRWAKARVQARESARREDAARSPEVEATFRTYETAAAIAEIKREALAAAADALPGASNLREKIVQCLDDWHDAPPDSAGSADEMIEKLRAARAEALSHASQCNPLLEQSAVELENHPLTAELREVAKFFG